MHSLCVPRQVRAPTSSSHSPTKHSFPGSTCPGLWGTSPALSIPGGSHVSCFSQHPTRWLVWRANPMCLQNLCSFPTVGRQAAVRTLQCLLTPCRLTSNTANHRMLFSRIISLDITGLANTLQYNNNNAKRSDEGSRFEFPYNALIKSQQFSNHLPAHLEDRH